MNSDFILLNKTYQTVEFLNKILINFPNKETVLKNSIESNLYQMLENLFAFNINDTNRIKEKYLKEYLIHLSMINFFMHQAMTKKYINYKQAEKIGKICLDLKKITYTLMKGLTNEDKV